MEAINLREFISALASKAVFTGQELTPSAIATSLGQKYPSAIQILDGYHPGLKFALGAVKEGKYYGQKFFYFNDTLHVAFDYFIYPLGKITLCSVDKGMCSLSLDVEGVDDSIMINIPVMLEKDDGTWVANEAIVNQKMLTAWGKKNFQGAKQALLARTVIEGDNFKVVKSLNLADYADCQLGKAKYVYDVESAYAGVVVYACSFNLTVGDVITRSGNKTLRNGEEIEFEKDLKVKDMADGRYPVIGYSLKTLKAKDTNRDFVACPLTLDDGTIVSAPFNIKELLMQYGDELKISVENPALLVVKKGKGQLLKGEPAEVI